jgi:hypothetical protein
MIDEEADFGDITDAPAEAPKFKPKKLVKLSKAASKSQKTDQKVAASAVHVVSQNKEDGTNNLTGSNDEQVQAPRHQEHLQSSDSQPPLGTDGSTVDNFSDCGDVLEEPVQEEAAGKLHPESQRKPDSVSSRDVGTSDNSAATNLKVGIFASDVISKDDNYGEDENNDLCQKSTDQEAATVPDTCPPHVSLYL